MKYQYCVCKTDDGDDLKYKRIFSNDFLQKAIDHITWYQTDEARIKEIDEKIKNFVCDRNVGHTLCLPGFEFTLQEEEPGLKILGYQKFIMTNEDDVFTNICRPFNKFELETSFNQEPYPHCKWDGLMSGEEFLDNVKSGCITDYDGFVNKIYVDGYITNLGLFCEDELFGGDFLVSEDVWKEICQVHEVFVDWANK